MKSMKRSFFLTGVWLLCVKNASLVVVFLDLSSCIFNGNRHQHHLLHQNLVWFDKSKFPLLWSVDQTKHFTTNLILCQVILSCLSTYFVYPYLDILVMHKTFTKLISYQCYDKYYILQILNITTTDYSYWI